MSWLKELSLVLIIGSLGIKSEERPTESPRVISGQDVRDLINPLYSLWQRTTPKPEEEEVEPTKVTAKPTYNYEYLPEDEYYPPYKPTRRPVKHPLLYAPEYPEYPEYPPYSYYPWYPPKPASSPVVVVINERPRRKPGSRPYTTRRPATSGTTTATPAVTETSVTTAAVSTTEPTVNNSDGTRYRPLPPAYAEQYYHQNPASANQYRPPPPPPPPLMSPTNEQQYYHENPTSTNQYRPPPPPPSHEEEYYQQNQPLINRPRPRPVAAPSNEEDYYHHQQEHNYMPPPRKPPTSSAKRTRNTSRPTRYKQRPNIPPPANEEFNNDNRIPEYPYAENEYRSEETPHEHTQYQYENQNNAAEEEENHENNFPKPNGQPPKRTMPRPKPAAQRPRPNRPRPIAAPHNNNHEEDPHRHHHHNNGHRNPSYPNPEVEHIPENSPDTEQINYQYEDAMRGRNIEFNAPEIGEINQQVGAVQLAIPPRSRRKTQKQEALIYLRNYQKGRKLSEETI